MNKGKQTNGYIYVRRHISWEEYNACKLGKTINIAERDAMYATGEIVRGHFSVIYEIPNQILDATERLLQSEFKDLNVKRDGGTEFYDISIQILIEKCLIKYNIV